MKEEVPVFLTRVECPVCKTVNEFETIKIGAYTESGSDTDFCPTGRQWRNPKYQHINPLLYFMATCSACYYTREFNKTFRDWKNNTQFRTYRQKAIRTAHLNALAQPDSVTKMLANACRGEEWPTETAILKLLLGIYDEMLLDRPSQLDLGRWYLRIGWLFRETTNEPHAKAPPVAVLKHQLTPALKKLRDTFDETGSQLQGIWQMLTNEDMAEATMPVFGQKCRNEIGNWHSQIQSVREEIDELLEMPDDDPIATGTGQSDATLNVTEPFDAFLFRMRELWEAIPLNEEEAISRSLKHYEQAFREGAEVSTGNQQIQIAYMIGELARRTNQFARADEFFRVALKSGHEWVHRHAQDRSKTALARRIIDLAMEQSQLNRDALHAANG